MTTPTPLPAPEDNVDEEPIITPSSGVLARERAQNERRRQLKRFNLLYIYLPLTMLVVFLITMVVLLGWVSLSEGGANISGREQASGVADFMVITLCLVPMSLLCLVFPGAGGYLLYLRRKKGSFVRERVAGLMHKAEGGLESADAKLADVQPKVVDGTIKVRQQIDRILDTIYDTFANLSQTIDRQLRRDQDNEDE